MLKTLIVKNFAIIEEAKVNFKPLMTAITGQTGAGKSLVIDAIMLLLGDRADSTMVRYGEKEALVEGTFSPLSTRLQTALKNLDIPFEDEITISRKINVNGKNSIKINDKAITLIDLKNLGYLLGDVHVQHDTYRLINKETYLSFIDDYNDQNFLKLFNDYVIKRSNYFASLKKYRDALKKNNEINDQIDFLSFQANELKALDLQKGIDVELENEIRKLANFDKIYQALNEAYVRLDESLNLDSLYIAGEELNNIKEFDDAYLKAFESLNDAYYQIDEVKSYLYKAKDGLDYDPNYLDELNTKLFEIKRIKEKYHMTVDELIAYLDDINLKLSLNTNFDATIKELLAKTEDDYEKLFGVAIKLRNWRIKRSEALTTAIKKEAFDLALNNFEFKVTFNDIVKKDILNAEPFKENGLDEIDFLVSFNLGEPVKPLARVASGGELSRLMLAFKSLYVKEHDLSFIVFDEIDSGVSGEVARKIAFKMKEISRHVQVFAITHLANVAAVADNQLSISKEEADSRTKTHIKELTFEERIEEIAMMLSGLRLSKAMLETAKNLLTETNKA